MDSTLRTAVLDRDGRRCRLSLTRDCRLVATEVHHRIPKSRGGRLADDLLADRMRSGVWTADEAADLAFHLISICRECHTAAHGLAAAHGVWPGRFRTTLEADPRLIYEGPLEGVPIVWLNPRTTP